ncbi:DUF4245 domain-containing protein [Demetria terragena]|uniref:DUF4245 domain-containing protein n=1 Tax=Demetria terragena TaxID=63959 RepID=UPI00035F0A1E|nr:DUF4245 domain-containing protein [Demetria terragena]
MPDPTAQDSTPEPTAPPPQPPGRRGMSGNAKNMIYSMVAVLFGCVIWLWAVPQSPQDPKPVANVESIAREVTKEQKWDVALPQGLPKTWTPINVRLIRAADKPATWHAGYQEPDSEFVSAEQTKDGDTGWVNNQTQDGKPAGSSTVEGQEWTRYADGNFKSLVRAKPLNGLSTVVTGKVDWDQLEQFAGALKPLSTTTSRDG